MPPDGLGEPAAILSGGSEEGSHVADYDLSVRLDPDAKRLTGRGRIRFTNRTEAPTRELYFHLYLNAFRNDQSSFIRERAEGWKRPASERDRFGFIDVERLSLEGHDLLAERTFEHPDDDNAADRTVMRVPLPRSMPPGDTIDLDVAFSATLPPVLARSGYAGRFFMVGQWFPKLGVLTSVEDPSTPLGRRAAWICHQYHSEGEFFADYGSYKIAITVPRGFEVGATGRRVSSREDGPLVTHVFEQDRVHDFAFAADSRFIRRERDFIGAKVATPEERAGVAQRLGVDPSTLALSDVKIILLIEPEHLAVEDRYFRAAEQTLKWLGLWYGAYPYDVLTLVDGPRTAEAALGMEYPTLVAVGARWPSPDGGPNPERVTVHEIAHQYWYGLVGSNETEESWLDEGFTTHSTAKVSDLVYGPFVYAPSLLGLPLLPLFANVRLSALELERTGALVRPIFDAIVRPTWLYKDAASYGVSSYSRPALVLSALEAMLGEDVFLRGMRAYHQRYRYRHPTTRDFQAMMESVSGRALEGFFDAHVRSPATLDYGILEVSSRKVSPGAGVFDDGKLVTEAEAERASAEDVFENRVVLERRGELVEPVRAVITLEDGSERIETWDGAYRFREIAFETPSKVEAARVDPPLVLDVDPTNDSRRAKADWKPGLAYGAHALYLIQSLLQIVGGFL